MLISFYIADGLSLKQAGEKFKIPKTVLWRKLRKKLDDGVLPNILSPRRRLQDPNLKEKASLALQKGHSISNVAKKYNVSAVIKTACLNSASNFKCLVTDTSCHSFSAKEVFGSAGSP